MKNRIGAVILAAGYSSRMKKFKALLPIDGDEADNIVDYEVNNKAISGASGEAAGGASDGAAGGASGNAINWPSGETISETVCKVNSADDEFAIKSENPVNVSHASKGESAIERIIHNLKAVGISDIVVVTGFQCEKLKPIIEAEKVREAYNPDFDMGMFTSIQTGFRAMKDLDVTGFLLMPVDCPAVKPDILKMILDKAIEFAADPDLSNQSDQPDLSDSNNADHSIFNRYDANRTYTDQYGLNHSVAKCSDTNLPGAKHFIVPCYYGKKGHPLYIPISYADETLALPGNSPGFKIITNKYDDFLFRMETGSESVILDMDTWSGYEEIVKYIRGGCKEASLAELAVGHRFVLIRHGQIRQHKDKIFLGQFDVPLSELGKKQAAMAGSCIAEEIAMLDTDCIYSSDLIRAYKSAEIIADKLEISNIIKESAFREMALGEWDGQYIKDIKEKYPEEYERRGRDIFKFKLGYDSENFYDLQYRVLKRLKELLKKEIHRDVLIVAHSGVIRVISNALAGLDVTSDSYNPLQNGEFTVITK